MVCASDSFRMCYTFLNACVPLGWAGPPLVLQSGEWAWKQSLDEWIRRRVSGQEMGEQLPLGTVEAGKDGGQTSQPTATEGEMGSLGRTGQGWGGVQGRSE